MGEPEGPCLACETSVTLRFTYAKGPAGAPGPCRSQGGLFVSLCPAASDARDLWRPPLSLLVGVREALPEGAQVRDGQQLRALWGGAGAEGAGELMAAARMP